MVLARKMDGPAVPTPSARSVLHPLGHDAVALAPGGWLGAWQARTTAATLPHVLGRVEEGEARANLVTVAEAGADPFVGLPFTDSDVYKTLEAVAWAAPTLQPGDPLLDRAERLVELLERAQEHDGYLNSHVQGNTRVARWADPKHGHELYCAGHLFQAAVAAVRTGVLPGLVTVATRFADLLVARFGPDAEAYVEGHPEVETALVELYRLTGARPYLLLAARQLDQRGYGRLGGRPFGSAYYQDHVPVRAATAATGHAVRQLYLLAGAVDVAVETHDAELLAAAERLWQDLFSTKTYLTGAHGSRHRDEAIGDPYELPPDRAYAETCAAIASFQLNWRLLLATGQARYAQEMETALYNAIAGSTSVAGTAFFYSNPLHLRTGHDGSDEDAPTQRLPWFTCACCPPNLARLLASVHDYLLTTTADGVQVHQYAPARTELIVADAGVVLVTSTDHPFDGAVDIEVTADRAAEWELALRIPAWCRDWQVLVDGVPADAAAGDGYARVRRTWGPSHAVRLVLDMPIRTVAAHPRVDAVRGCVAVARGPVLYAVEQADLGDVVLEDVRLVEPIAARRIDDARIGPVVLDLLVAVTPGGGLPLYPAPDASPSQSDEMTITAVPYHRWANREPGAMRVWLPVAD